MSSPALLALSGYAQARREGKLLSGAKAGVLRGDIRSGGPAYQGIPSLHWREEA
jgi:hypothetical protein